MKEILLKCLFKKIYITTTKQKHYNFGDKNILQFYIESKYFRFD